jgi:hypothetical protein
MVVEQPVGGVGGAIDHTHGDARAACIKITAQGGYQSLRLVLGVVADVARFNRDFRKVDMRDNPLTSTDQSECSDLFWDRYKSHRRFFHRTRL